MAEEEKTLLGKRSYIKGRITHYENMFANIEQINRVSDLQIALAKINTHFQGLEPTQIQLEILDFDKHFQEGLDLETRHLKLIQKIQHAIDTLNDSRNSLNLSARSGSNTNLNNHDAAPHLRKSLYPIFPGISMIGYILRTRSNVWLEIKNLYQTSLNSAI